MGKKIAASAGNELRAVLELDTSLAMDVGKLNSEKVFKTARKTVLGPTLQVLTEQVKNIDVRERKVRDDMMLSVAMTGVKELPGGGIVAVIVPEALKIHEERTKMDQPPENLMKLVISVLAIKSRWEESLANLETQMQGLPVSLPPLYINAKHYKDIQTETQKTINRINNLAAMADRLHQRMTATSS